MKDTHGDSLGATARWTAAVRARESERDDRLFHDPFAPLLAGEVGLRWIETRTPESYVSIAIRTRYFDDFLLGVATEQGIRQFVFVGAGMDSRAFRLNWPQACVIFELDKPEVLREKERLLATVAAVPACSRRAVDADLVSDWQATLLDSGYRTDHPSCWLFEGILFYLPVATLTSLLLSAIRLTADGSFIAFDIINGAMLQSPYTKTWVQMQAEAGAPWIGTMDDPLGFLAEHGVTARLTQAGAADASYGRWQLPVLPVDAPDFPHNWFVTGRKGA